MLFSPIKCYFLLFISLLEKKLWGQFCEPKLPPIDPTMEVAFVKHDLRNISALGEDGIGATVQCKMHDFQHVLYAVALTCGLRSHPPQGPKYSLGHA